MDLGEALSKILSAQQFVVSSHFEEQCIDRGLDVLEVRHIIQKNTLLGILEQDHNLYKVWFAYTDSKDLNVVVKFLSSDELRLITVFPCYSKRRKK